MNGHANFQPERTTNPQTILRIKIVNKIKAGMYGYVYKNINRNDQNNIQHYIVDFGILKKIVRCCCNSC